MMVVPTITLKGYKIRTGSAYTMMAQVSLMGAAAVVRQQVADSFHRFQSLGLTELHWVIAEKHLRAFINVYYDCVTPPTLEEFAGQELFGLKINILRGPEHRDPTKAPGHPGGLRQKFLRG